MKNPVFAAVYGTVRQALADNIVGVAAQTAFFLLLSLFPLAMTVVSVLTRLDIAADELMLSGVLPASVINVIDGVLQSGATSPTLTAVTLSLSLWSASAGVWALMRGICISSVGRRPSYLRGRVAAILVTAGFLFMLSCSLVLWVFGRQLFVWIAGFVPLGEWVLVAARYVFTLFLIFTFLVSVYAVSPGVPVRGRRLVPGAIVAALGWGAVSRGYELYIRFFRDYSTLYGGMGAFVGLAVWLLVISFVILAGAEINAAIDERGRG